MLIFAAVIALVVVAASRKPTTTATNPSGGTGGSTGGNPPASGTPAQQTGGAALAAAVGGAIGGVIGEFDKYALAMDRRDAPMVASAITPICAGIGAIVGAALVLTSLTLSTVAIWAFPVFVALFAIFDIAGAIESEMRSAQLRVYQNEAQRLFNNRQYLACFRYVNERRLDGAQYDKDGNLTKIGWNVVMPARVLFNGLPNEPGIFGDCEYLPLADNHNTPNGQAVKTYDILHLAYKPAVDAFLGVRSNSPHWSEDQRTQWLMANGGLFEWGDKLADAIEKAFPWFSGLKWRPVWPAYSVGIAPPPPPLNDNPGTQSRGKLSKLTNVGI